MAGEDIPVEVACRVLDVSVSGYYAWLTRPPSARMIRHAWLTDVITELHQASRSIYGARCIHAELTLGCGICVSHGQAELLMRRSSLQGVTGRPKWRRAKPDLIASDLVDRQFTRTALTSCGSPTSPSTPPVRERCTAIDLLDGRTADDLAAWLKDHPGVQVICRDRAGNYADGARAGAPDAVQVADRFHFWQNLAQALENMVRAHRSSLQETHGPNTAIEDETDGDVEPVERPKTLDSYGNERPMVARTQELYAQVQALRNTGASLNAISRELGLAFRTARKYATATSVDELLSFPPFHGHVT
ncbi:transposase [Actinomadura napierensis]|uniref:Transposase n=1 Tax=Actinomadura napierensis TaxID=267854 RepID=A0ABP5K7G4_9ACTN